MPTILALHYTDGTPVYLNWDNVIAFLSVNNKSTRIEMIDGFKAIVKEDTTEIIAQILRG